MTSVSETLCWRVDMACRAAWPSARAANIGGWQARRSGGPIRRVNSLNPLPGCQPPGVALLESTAGWYRDLTAAPSADWLSARDRIGGSDGERFAKMLTMIHDPAGFASVRVDGEIASLAYGVIHDRMLIVESVITDEAHRGQGLARQVVSGLIGWAVSRGVGDAALQVVADNEPARALYRRFGFGNHLYGYRYMRRP